MLSLSKHDRKTMVYMHFTTPGKRRTGWVRGDKTDV
jgi:hypothetical protein